MDPTAAAADPRPPSGRGRPSGLGALVGTLSVGLLAGAPWAGGAGASPPLEVHTARVASLGTVLVTQRQLVLYEYGADAKNRSNCSGACAKVWPPYLLATGVKTVHGPRDLVGLGTIRRGHRLQVSINGHPLYTFSGDHGVDQAHGQGFGGVWYVVSSSGHIVRTNVGAPAPVTSPPATSPPVTSPPTTSPPTTSPGGGGYGY